MEKKETTRKTKEDKVVAGYLFRCEGSPQDNNICQIVSRVIEDGTLMEEGPTFRVKFGDGEKMVVSGYELSPWFSC